MPDRTPDAAQRLRRIRPHEARMGMYIHGFDGKWLSHPFWRTHFLVEDDHILDRLRQSTVPAIIVDDARAAGAAPVPPARAAAEAGAARPSNAAPRPPVPPAPAPAVSINPRDDLEQAQQLVERSKQVVRKAFDSARLGKAIRSRDVIGVVDDISDSIRRNRSMLSGITRLKTKDEYTYLHSVAVCALMINFAREIGLDEGTVRDLGIAGLLHDVGKMGVDDAILHKAGPLTDDEFTEIRHHALRGHAMLAAGEGVPDIALDVCLHHHEKVDGRGYPFRLAGDDISLYARMGAICDIYDAMTSVRAYKNAMAPADAIAAMRSWTGHLDPVLLVQFMQSIGVFEVGMMVRLRCERLALVLPGGRRNPRPRLRVFHCAKTDRSFDPYDLVVHDRDTAHRVVAEARAEDWTLPDWEARKARLLGH